LHLSSTLCPPCLTRDSIAYSKDGQNFLFSEHLQIASSSGTVNLLVKIYYLLNPKIASSSGIKKLLGFFLFSESGFSWRAGEKLPLPPGSSTDQGDDFSFVAAAFKWIIVTVAAAK
jgi:hypothetical protein